MYSPLTGDPNDTKRRPVANGPDTYHVPITMLDDPDYSPALDRHSFNVLRFRHDFEFWAATCVKIIHKDTKQSVPFILNRPQRRLLDTIERQRLLNLPVRLIMLKARQWGGSTLIQIYFAWIQIIHLRNWHSLICAHVKDTAATIRGMYTHLLANYPREYWDDDSRPELRPFEHMNNTRTIPGRGCRITVCSSENQESTRGMDCSMAHLSEVAFWKDSTLHSPADLIRSVTSGIARRPMTFIAMESTANGAGNFFHREWLRAVDGKSDKTPFFVPWHEIGLYTEPVDDPAAFAATLNGYERQLRDTHGCSLEAIKWYRNKSREYTDRRSMMAEFPTTPEEAFSATDTNVFSASDVAILRRGCVITPSRGEVDGSPAGIPSDLSAPRLRQSPQGNALIWTPPRPHACYIASLDIGGRSRQSDFSVITVLDRHTDTPAEHRPEVVAQWRGHIDHDLLAWRAAALAAWYNTALLVIESNSWEASSEGRGQYILETLADRYPNMYYRRSDSASRGYLPGFHTNIRTKASLIAHMISLVRDNAYIERDTAACDELLQYESRPDGSYGARRGCHDDMLMSRAIALWVHATAATAAITPADLRALLSQ